MGAKLIYLMAILGAAIMCLLPIWVLPIFCVIAGFSMKLRWRQALKLGLIAAVLVILVAAFLDFRDQGLIGKRMGGVFKIPNYVVPLLPGVLVIWIGVFFTRLGSSLRILIKR